MYHDHLKKRVLTATFPDGTILQRTTARDYTHVVSSEGHINKHNCSWCGRPDLVGARLKDFANPVVGVVTNDPRRKD